MAAKVATTVIVQRNVIGNMSLAILQFPAGANDIDDTDTVDLLAGTGMSTIAAVWWQADVKSADTLAWVLSGTGNTTATAACTTSGQSGMLFVLGNP